jgi:ParB-like chromosome segregation protein Spo0J
MRESAPDNPTHIKDLVPDPANRRQHNPRNIGMVVDALHQVGAARSIVIDEANVILAGNGVVEAAGEAGLTRVRVIEADGQEIIAVRRTGLTDAQKRALAIYDNRTGELATWSTKQFREDLEGGQDFAAFFTPEELAAILAKEEEPDAPMTPEAARATLAERFIVPPFSVLDARQGYWQTRKRAWLALGIESEIGRGGHLAGVPDRRPK